MKSLGDWETNLSIKPIKGNSKIFTNLGFKMKGSFQSGFLTKAAGIFNKGNYQILIRSYIKKGYELIFTGHSQGGALAGNLALFAKKKILQIQIFKL